MIKDSIFSLKSPYRDELKVTGYRFGKGEKTACIVGAIRGNEIQQWLDIHKEYDVEDFIILDDDSDMEHLIDHLIQTDSILGITYYIYEQIISRWGEEEK